jgi:polyisoprenoid-binding protein YceI
MQKDDAGPEVLDSEGHQEIVFKSTGTEPADQGRWTLRGNLTLHGQTRPLTVRVTLKHSHYTGETTVKQTDFGIKPPGKSGVRAKDEVRIDFEVWL